MADERSIIYQKRLVCERDGISKVLLPCLLLGIPEADLGRNPVERSFKGLLGGKMV